MQPHRSPLPRITVLTAGALALALVGAFVGTALAQAPAPNATAPNAPAPNAPAPNATGAGPAGPAPAEGSAVAKRQAVYKGWAAATRQPAAMLQDKAPFDLPTVQATFKVYGEGARSLKDLFPDDSKPGAANGTGTKALPAIWDNKADFEARLAKFAADSDAAAKAVTDLATFKAAMPGILGQCGSCHNVYREKS